MGQIFLYRANFKIKKKGKRLDFQTLPSGQASGMRQGRAWGSGSSFGRPWPSNTRPCPQIPGPARPCTTLIVGADRARQSNDKPTWLVVVVVVGADRARRTQDEPQQAYAACRHRCVSPKVGTTSLHGSSASLS